MNGSPCNDMAKINEVKSLKVIAPERVLDSEKLGIIPIGTDEQFVRIGGSNTHYISNYGRCLSVTDKVKMQQGFHDEYGKIKYYVFIWENGERSNKKIAADRLVLDTFYEYDKANRQFIWHAGNNLEDNYYQNLYPVNRREYFSIRKYVETGGFDSAEKIFEMIAGEAYMIPSMFGVGYWGMPNVDVFDKTYIRWHNMLARCYSEKHHKRFPSYRECKVADEWLNYSNYKKWIDENYYTVDDEVMEVDKDILHKGNKLYSPDNCVFVPRSINSLFVSGKASRGDLPIGITRSKNGKEYIVRARSNQAGKHKQRIVGHYDNIIDAFEKYKEEKEKLIQETAEQYKDKIPQKLYDAMMNWVVDIGD